MLGIAYCNLMLVFSCSAVETHFIKLVMQSSCADVASRGSLEICSEWCKSIADFYTLGASALMGPTLCCLCGLPHGGWAAVVPTCLHFTTIALTQSWLGQIQQWRNVTHWLGSTMASLCMTALCLRSLSSSVRPFLLHGLNGDYVPSGVHLLLDSSRILRMQRTQRSLEETFFFYVCPVSPIWARILNTSPVSSWAFHLHLISVWFMIQYPAWVVDRAAPCAFLVLHHL